MIIIILTIINKTHKCPYTRMLTVVIVLVVTTAVVIVSITIAVFVFSLTKTKHTPAGLLFDWREGVRERRLLFRERAHVFDVLGSVRASEGTEKTNKTKLGKQRDRRQQQRQQQQQPHTPAVSCENRAWSTVPILERGAMRDLLLQFWAGQARNPSEGLQWNKCKWRSAYACIQLLCGVRYGVCESRNKKKYSNTWTSHDIATVTLTHLIFVIESWVDIWDNNTRTSVGLPPEFMRETVLHERVKKEGGCTCCGVPA